MIKNDDISKYVNIANEIEIRFDNINASIFYRIKDVYQLNNPQHSIDTYYKTNDEKIRIRSVKSDDNSTKIIKKSRLFYKKNEAYDFRLSVSKEEELNTIPTLVVEMIRDKKRWRHETDNSILEITEVNTTTNNTTITSWEIELELKPTPNLTNLALINRDIHNLLLKIQDTEILYTSSLKSNTINDWNALMGSVGNKKVLDTKILVKARNLKRRDLVHGNTTGIDKGYMIAQKADGVSKCLYISNNKIWLLSPPSEMNLLMEFKDDRLKLYHNICLIGELVPEYKRHNITTPYYFIPYDILSYSTFKNKIQDYIPGDKTINFSYDKRLNYVKQLVDKIKNFCSNIMTIETKNTMNIGYTPESFAIAYQTVKNTPANFDTDGLILTPIYASYNPHSDEHPLSERKLTSYPDVCKIKPWEELTIDFRIVDTKIAKDICTGKNNRELEKALYVTDSKNNGKMTCFNGDGYFPFYQDININWDHSLIKNLSGGIIVEFGPVRRNNLIILEPKRIRNDKQHPNSLEIAKDVWSDINSYLEESTIMSKDFEKLFQQNNKIKRKLFDDLEENTILIDIGSGKGGDLTKWKNASFIYCIEPNPNNLEELYNRIKYYKMENKVKVLECGGEDTQYILDNIDINNKHVTVSMMLSLSFFWKDLNMLEMLQKTLVEIANLASNEVNFLYYTIEKDRTLKLFEKMGNDITLGPCHMVYSDPEIFINIENTIVVNQTEYLVNLEDLKRVIGRNEHSGIIEQYLSNDEKEYGGLFVYGVGSINKFYKNNIKPTILTKIIIETDEPTASQELVQNNLYRFKTLTENGSFFHAFLNAISREYRTSDNKTKLVKEFRFTLADYLSAPNPKYTNEQQVTDLLTYNPKTKFPFLEFNSYFSSSRYFKDRDYDKYKNLLFSDEEVDIDDIKWLTELFNLNIKIYNKFNLETHIDNLYSTKSINIYKLQSNKFEVMGYITDNQVTYLSQ